MQILEAELTRLRPLLLMQPLSSSTPITTPRSKHRRRKKDTSQQHAGTDDEAVDASEDDAGVRGSSEVLDTPTHSLPSQSTPKSKLRNSAHFQSSTIQHKRQSSLKSSVRGLSADAKVEHLFLAARKVGKERASLMSGIMQQMGERERERRREDSVSTAVATTPKTPKRVAAYPGYVHPETGYVYLTSPMKPGSGMQPFPVFIPAFPPPVFQTPSSSATVASASSSSQQPAKTDAKSQNPHTPLDSLLSAARSMMKDGGEGANDKESGGAAGSRRLVEDDVPDSPLPKRRKLAPRDNEMGAQDLAGPSTPTANDTRGIGSNATTGRVRSALDVLADQAAVFSSQEISARPGSVQKKGKGKERADAPEPMSKSVPKPQKRSIQRRDVDADASPFFECPSRSITPVPNPGNSSLPSPKDKLTSEVPGDPGGGNGDDPSSSRGDDVGASLASITGVNAAPSPGSSTAYPEQDVDKTPTQIRSAVSKSTVHSRSQSQSTTATPSPPEPQPSTTSQQRAASPAITSNRATSPLDAQVHQPSETTPVAAPVAVTDSNTSDPPPGPSSDTPGPMLRNKNVARIAEQDLPTPRRQRSPYVKWSKEEDELLAQVKYPSRW